MRRLNRTCPYCGKRISVEFEDTATGVACPQCGQEIAIKVSTDHQKKKTRKPKGTK